MIKKITLINPISLITNFFDRKNIPCAWCFKEQLVYTKDKTHSCHFCGKTFHLSGNIKLDA